MPLHFDWRVAVAAVIVYGFVVVLLILAVRGGAKQADRENAYDLEPTPEGEELNRPDPLGEFGRRSQAWRAELLAELDGPTHHAAPLGLYGRMRAAVARVLKAPTKGSAVVPAVAEPEPEEQEPEPFDPLTSPIEVEPVVPVDSWTLVQKPRPAWDMTITQAWRAVDVSKAADPGPDYTAAVLAEMDAGQARNDAAAVLTEVSA